MSDAKDSSSAKTPENVKGRVSDIDQADLNMNDVVLNTWKELDLETLRTKLDTEALKIAEHQERASKGRRKLMEGTKAFKQKSGEEQAAAFTPLLKSYQEEIDNLSKRAKYSESCFLSVFQQLYEAPDPVAALSAASDNAVRVVELEAANRKLQLELDEFIAESAKLKNQQVTVRRLEERNRQLELQMQDKVKDVVLSKEKALAEEQLKSLESMKDREKMLLQQLEDANQTVGNLSQLHKLNQNQIFAIKSANEEEGAAKQAELEVLTQEIESAEQRQQDLEREKLRLNNALKEMEEGISQRKPEQEDEGLLKELKKDLEAKDRLVQSLHAELAEADATSAAVHEKSHAALQEARATIADKQDEIGKLSLQLSQRPTVKQLQDLQGQVKALQALGYNLVDEDGDDWEGGSKGGSSELESMLLAKNRKMEHDLTTLKNQLEEQTKQTEQAERKSKELSVKVDEQSKLLRQLEEDMARMGTSSKTGQKGEEAENSWEEGTGNSSLENALKQGGETGGRSGEGESGEARSVVNVVAEQRDRFRKRCLDLEEEARQLRMDKDQSCAQLSALKADNVTLYEKIKFLSAYQKDGNTSRGPRQQVGDVEAGSERDVMNKYGSMYDAGINPFAEFSRKEKDRGVKELRVHDRITLSSGRFLLGNKYTRTFIFFYSITLHLLVFTVLWRMSLHSMHTNHGISTEELCTRHRLMQNMQTIFAHADHDHNGVLDATEFEAAIEEETEGMHAH